MQNSTQDLQSSFDHQTLKCLICQKQNKNSYEAVNHAKKHHTSDTVQNVQIQTILQNQQQIEEFREPNQLTEVQRYRRIFNAALRGSIATRKGNVQIVSTILQYTYDLNDISQSKDVIGRILYKNKPFKLNYDKLEHIQDNSDFLTQSSDKVQHIEQFVNIVRAIIDICSNCCRINTVYFNRGQLLCPLCLEPMVNFNHYKFSLFKKYNIQIIDYTIVNLNIQSKRCYGIQELQITNPQNTNVQSIKESINGVLSQKTGNVSLHPVKLQWNQAELHGTCIIYDKTNFPMQEYQFEHGILNGECMDCLTHVKYQSIDLGLDTFINNVSQLRVEFNSFGVMSTQYMNGLKNGIETVQFPDLGQISQVTYINGLKNGAFILKCIDTVQRDGLLFAYIVKRLSGDYLNDRLDGKIEVFNIHNQQFQEYNFRNGVLDGQVRLQYPTDPRKPFKLYQYQNGIQLSYKCWQNDQSGQSYLFFEKYYKEEFKQYHERIYYSDTELKCEITPMPHGRHVLTYQFVKNEYGIHEHVTSSFELNPDYLKRITKYSKGQLKVLF